MNSKSVNTRFDYVIVMDGYKNVFQKQCMDIKEANELLSQKKEEYPKNTPGHEYQVTREKY